MIRSVVGTAFAGFQKAAVSGEFNEHELQLRSLRQDLRAMEDVVRQLLLETAALRAELSALRASGVQAPAWAAPVGGAPQPAEPPRAAPTEPVRPAPMPTPAAAPAQPTPAQPAPAQPAPAQPAPAAAPAQPAPAQPAPAQPAPAPSTFAALAAQAAAGKLDDSRHADDHSTDLEGYRERMRANGRDDSALAGEGLNTAPDGTPFVGPVNNESSRAKATGRVLTIDQWECISCGTCVEQTADVFFLPDGEKAAVLKQEGPMDLIQDAIDACPVTCIAWLEKDRLAEQHSAGGAK